MAGITLAQAQAQLDIWLEADMAVSKKQSYRIGDRQLAFANAAEITAKVEYWNSKVMQLSASASRRGRSATMVR